MPGCLVLASGALGIPRTAMGTVGAVHQVPPGGPCPRAVSAVAGAIRLSNGNLLRRPDDVHVQADPGSRCGSAPHPGGATGVVRFSDTLCGPLKSQPVSVAGDADAVRPEGDAAL